MNNKLRIEVLKGLENLSIKEMDDRIKYRGLDCKRINRINEAIECYENKIPRIENILEEEKDKDVRKILTEKIDRLKDKLACCIKELELREKKLVNRTNLHDTIYYIDLTNGNDANDGLSANNDHSWKTIGKYTTTTVRTAGDIAYVRANTTQTLAAAVAFDEDGTFNSPISIIGCDAVTNDPWGDASNILPIIDSNSANYYLNIASDDYWTIDRIEFNNLVNASQNTGCIYISAAKGTIISSCVFEDSTIGVYLRTGSVVLNGCEFDTCTLGVYTINASDAFIDIKNTTFDNCTIGLLHRQIILVRLYNCSFGATAANTTDLSIAGLVIAYNCVFTTVTYSTDTAVIYSESHNQVVGAHQSSSKYVVISKDTTITLDSEPSIKLSPSASSYSPYSVILNAKAYTYALYLEAGTYNISIKARETAAWATNPTADEFYLEAIYFDSAITDTKAFVKSTQSLSGTSEIPFTVSVSPAKDSFVYLTFYLWAYEEGKSINMSIKPSVT